MYWSCAEPCVCTIQTSPRGVTDIWWPCCTHCSGLHQKQINCIAPYTRTALKFNCLTCACIYHACMLLALLDHITWQPFTFTANTARGSTLPAHTVSDSASCSAPSWAATYLAWRECGLRRIWWGFQQPKLVILVKDFTLVKALLILLPGSLATTCLFTLALLQLGAVAAAHKETYHEGGHGTAGAGSSIQTLVYNTSRELQW